ncbi:hypothetical protein [Paraburkholderia youngii]|uniref:hypothetical protein n=1 Tax=Paraburkholderia youngii TaxID=2782701 RepID=UPI003D1B6C73
MNIQHNAPLLVAAEMSPAWSYDHETLAAREGWQISECTGSDNGPWQVANFASPEDHRDAFGFLPPYLDGDAAAMRVVANGTGEHHLAARAFLLAHNPLEHAAVMKMVDSTRERAAGRRLSGMLRYGSRRLKNAVARAGGSVPSAALTQVRNAEPQADGKLSRKKLFALGRDVSYALPVGVSVLRPSRDGLQAAATKIGITYAQAQRALGVFNSAG